MSEIVKCPPCMGIKSHAVWHREGSVMQPICYFRKPCGVDQNVFDALMEGMQIILTKEAVEYCLEELEASHE